MSLISGYQSSLLTAPSTSPRPAPAGITLAQAVDRQLQFAPAATQGVTGAAPARVQAHTLFAAQSIAQGMAAGSTDVSASPVGSSSAKDDFLAYQQMTTAEKIRAMVLGEMGMTEEELAALPPEEREKIEEKIRARIKELVEEDVRDQQQDTKG